RGLQLLAPSLGISLIALVFVIQGPALWFRHMSLYGLSSPSQSRSLPVSLFQPVLAILLASMVFPPATVALAFSAVVYLVLGFVCVLLFLRAVDRPLRKEFDSSGLAMMRPLLDHVNRRDPAATQKLEEFFLKSAIPMNLRVSLIGFFAGGRARATIALPTVHPGPFGALGASDLPRKLSERLGPDAGVVFV
ncbi:membrane protein, partial [mine drainage metagenome]